MNSRLTPTHLPDLLHGGWRDAAFEPFREGVEIAWLEEPRIALLRYQPGAGVPLHEHPDVEMIVVLDGAQSDERGTYRAGDVVLNAKGSRHSVWSDEGCVVLIHWSEAVRFL